MRTMLGRPRSLWRKYYCQAAERRTRLMRHFIGQLRTDTTPRNFCVITAAYYGPLSDLRWLVEPRVGHKIRKSGFCDDVGYVVRKTEVVPPVTCPRCRAKVWTQRNPRQHRPLQVLSRSPLAARTITKAKKDVWVRQRRSEEIPRPT
jgi:hypothetical protein